MSERVKICEGFVILRCDNCGVEERSNDSLRLAQGCARCHGWMRLAYGITYDTPTFPASSGEPSNG
jgi:hypothetical protein